MDREGDRLNSCSLEECCDNGWVAVFQVVMLAWQPLYEGHQPGLPYPTLRVGMQLFFSCFGEVLSL